MAENNPMMKGIESLFDNNADKFEKEKSFGKKLYKTAWAVEILAALLGLLIAFFMAFDAYNAVDDKTFSVGLNALLGALPFLLIAIIEPTKIPLAGGLYKIKHWGWKILIAISLIGLTLVTFETIFTGLERQVTNVTSKISRGEDEIRYLEETKTENESQLDLYQSISIGEQTSELENKINSNREEREKDLFAERKRYDQRVAQLTTEISDAQNTILSIRNQRKLEQKDSLGPLRETVANLNSQIAREQEKSRSFKIS